MTVPRFDKPPYYITAYGLAVKRGFKGTLDDWLASLKAHEIELRYQDEKLQWRRISDADAADEDAEYEPDDPRAWHDLMDIADIRGPVVEETLQEALTYAKEAKESAESIAGRVKDIDQLLQDVADLKYVPIEITSISNSAGTVEMGSTVDTLTISWQLNKEPVSQTANGEAVAKDARSVTLEGLGLTENMAFAVTATDERETRAAATTAVTFLNGVYCGTLADGTTLDSAAILSLTRKLQSGKGMIFTADAGDGERITYALPARYGTPRFNVGGFDGGFNKAATVEFTNASGYTESYDVWLSDNTGLGSTTIKVT